MQEVEVKILEVDKQEIITKLEKLGARKVFSGEICASYFDFPNEILTKENKILRLRTKGKDYCELTFKKKLSKEKAKVMEEHELSFTGDTTVLRNILEGTGLQEFKKITKYRISYSLGDLHFELDKMPDIPLFLEIEATSVERVKEAVEMVGFTMNDAKPWSGKDVLNYYRK